MNWGHFLDITGLSRLSTFGRPKIGSKHSKLLHRRSAEQGEYQADHKKNQKYKKQNLGDTGRRGGNTGKPEQSGD
jgi:hypothetical protein